MRMLSEVKPWRVAHSISNSYNGLKEQEPWDSEKKSREDEKMMKGRKLGLFIENGKTEGSGKWSLNSIWDMLSLRCLKEDIQVNVILKT